MSKITEKVEAMAGPVVKDEGCELWSVEYVREAGTWYLRVFIDKEGGVGSDDCERISRRLDPMLDEADPIPNSYVFEVSSAGIERELKRPSDFEKYMGHEVELKFYRPVEGAKSVIGFLTGYADGNVSVDDRVYEKSQIAQVKLHITF